MGRIIYKPHCAECGALINDEVIYRRLELINPKNCFFEIKPNRCESCGAWFEAIAIPMPKEK